MRLKHRVTISLLVVSILPICVIGIMGVRSMYKIRDKATHDAQRSLIEATRSNLQNRVQDIAISINDFFLNIQTNVTALSEEYKTILQNSGEIQTHDFVDYYADRQPHELPGFGYIHPQYGMYGDFEKRAPTTSYIRKSIVEKALQEPEFRAEIEKSLYRTKRMEGLFKFLTNQHKETLDLVWIVLTNGVINVCPPYELNTMIENDPTVVDLDENEQVYVKLLNSENNPNHEIKWLTPYVDPIRLMWMTSCIAPLYENDRFIGTMGMDVLLTYIAQMVQNVKIQNGYGFLIDSRTVPIALPREGISELISTDHRLKYEMIFTKKLDADRLQDAKDDLDDIKLIESANQGLVKVLKEMTAQQTKVETIELDGKKKFIAFTPAGIHGWSFGLVTDYDATISLSSSIRTTIEQGGGGILKWYFLILGFVFALCLLIGIRNSYQITHPVRHLISVTHDISRGNLDIEAKMPETTTEFAEIERSLVDMAAKLKQSETSLKTYATNLEALVDDRTKQLKQTNDELKSFSYSVSHDLQAPLRRVGFYCEMLLSDQHDRLNAEGQECLHNMILNVRSMSSLVDNMLILSRANNREFRKVQIDMRQVAETMYKQLQQGQPERSVDFILKDLPNAIGDPDMLSYVYTNLFSNALKFTQPRDKAIIEVGSFNRQGETVYYVKDNGVGFDMQYADALFLPFQRLHSNGNFSGSGIGLAIVDRIIKRHGGKVWAEGKVNEGATFFFTLNA